jgi:hypothetical protein
MPKQTAGKKTKVVKKEGKKTQKQKKEVVEVPIIPAEVPIIPAKVPAEGKKGERSFTVFRMVVDEVETIFDKKNEHNGGRYIGKAPKQAGKKAVRQIIKNIETDTGFKFPDNKEVAFTIRETTQGRRLKSGLYREFNYVGMRKKLDTPKEVGRALPKNYDKSKYPVEKSIQHGGKTSKDNHPFICSKTGKLIFIHTNEYVVFKNKNVDKKAMKAVPATRGKKTGKKVVSKGKAKIAKPAKGKGTKKQTKSKTPKVEA